MLLVGFGRRGPIGGFLYDSFGITIAFTWKGAAVAAAVMAFPLMVRAIRLSIETVDPCDTSNRLEVAITTEAQDLMRVRIGYVQGAIRSNV